MSTIPSGLGPVTPLNGAASRARSVEEVWPDARPRGQIDRTRHTSAAQALTPNEVYDSILEGAMPQGGVPDRTPRTAMDAGQAARRAPQHPIDEARMVALERTVERQGADIRQILAKLTELAAAVDAAGSFGGAA